MSKGYKYDWLLFHEEADAKAYTESGPEADAYEYSPSSLSFFRLTTHSCGCDEVLESASSLGYVGGVTDEPEVVVTDDLTVVEGTGGG